MKTIIRNGLAILVGLLVGSAMNMALISAGPAVFPPPAGVDLTDAASLRESARLLEPRHFVFPFLAHAAGTLVGALAAYLIARSYRLACSYTIGALFLLGGIAAAFMIPAPAWFVALDLLVAYIPMAWLGTRAGRRIV